MGLKEQLAKLSPEEWARVMKEVAEADALLSANCNLPGNPGAQELLNAPYEELVQRRRNALLSEAEKKGVMTDRAHRDIRHDLPEEVSTLMFMEVMDALYDNGYVVVRKCDLRPPAAE